MARKMRKYVMQFKDENKPYGNSFVAKEFEATSARVAEKKARKWANRKRSSLKFLQSLGRKEDRKRRPTRKKSKFFSDNLFSNNRI